METLDIVVDNKIAYVYIKEENEDVEEHYLYYSKDTSLWTESTAGTLAIKIVDDGNAIKIIPQLDEVIEYHKIAELKYLLNICFPIEDAILSKPVGLISNLMKNVNF